MIDRRKVQKENIGIVKQPRRVEKNSIKPNFHQPTRESIISSNKIATLTGDLHKRATIHEIFKTFRIPLQDLIFPNGKEYC